MKAKVLWITTAIQKQMHRRGQGSKDGKREWSYVNG
jgi:hypothetical protein